MAAGDKVAKVLLEFEIQKQKLAETRQGVADFNKDVQALGPTALKSGQGVDFLLQRMSDARQRTRDARDASADFRAGLLGLDTSLKDASSDTVSLAGNLQKVRDQIEQTKAAADAAGPSIDELTGDAGNSGSRINGPAGLKRGGEVLSRIGFGEAGRGLSTVGDIANVDKFKQELSSLSPTVLAAGAGVGLLTIALDLYTKQQEAARQAALSELDARARSLELARTGTAQEIRDQLDKLQKQKEINKLLADDANKVFFDVKQQLVAQFGGGATGLQALGLETVAASIGKAAGEFQAASDNADKATKNVSSLDTEIQILEQASGQAARSTKEAAAAEQQLADVRKKLSIFGENASDLKQILDLEATGTDTKQVQDLVDSKKREIEVNKIYQQASLDLAATLDKNSQAYKDAIAEAQKYADANARAQNQIDRITQSTYDLVGARQKEAETLDAVKKFQDESTKDTDTYLAKVTDIATKNAEKIVELANKKADAEEQALKKLNDRIADLNLQAQYAVQDAATKQQRDDLAAQQKFQTQQAKDARDHANKLLDIQRQANAKAEDLIAARDFSGLFRLRRDTSNQLQDESTRYQQQAQDRIDAFTEDRNARLVQYAQEAQDRQTKYDRDLAAANAQYTKEYKTAESNYNKQVALQNQAAQKELSTLQTNYNTQQTLLQQALTNQLRLFEQGNVARAISQNASNQQLLALAEQYRQGIYGIASGAGGAGGIGAIPGLNSITNSRSQTNNFSINGSNAQGIANALHKIVRGQIAYYLG